ncbi:HAD-IA family hydrolase [Streptomyces silaceus]|uniref:HAD-IA family hydrolase n=1 Tax=Streptomyces silaceus TaxID=545123 RepID=UPI00099F11E2|nr:HAD-IA family hydrolase [Streptomyces silaceus]
MPSSPPRNPQGAPKSGRRETWIRHLADAHRNRPDREIVAGYHNINYVVPLGVRLALLLHTMPFRARVKCRMPIEAVEVVPRIWPSETDLLAVVSRHLKEVPRCYRDFGDWSLHSYRAGTVLSEAQPHGPVGDAMLLRLAEFFAKTASVPEEELPPRPADWPESGQSEEFLNWLIDFTEDRVHGPNRRRFDELFTDLGIRPDAMTAFRDDPDRPRLTPRPFCLLHTDVHRANVVVDRKQVAVIDWELAMYGDPLHDLATHLVRMDYDKDEHAAMTRMWAEEMERAGHEKMTEGLDADLPVYLDFEYAQSVFPDVMRAALGLTTLPGEPDAADYAGAAVRVCRALRRAAEPLKLRAVPDEGRAERALRDWYEGPFGRALSARAEDRTGGEAGDATADDTDGRGHGGDVTGSEGREAADEGCGGGAGLAGNAEGAEGREGRAGAAEPREPRPEAVEAYAPRGDTAEAYEPQGDTAEAYELREARRLLAARADAGVLLDFDGPICRLFPDGSSKRVADDLRALARRHGLDGVLGPEEKATIDPHDVLRAMDRALSDSALIAEFEKVLTKGEVAAARKARPTPGAHRLIRALRARGVRIAVVTNNSPHAVAAHLRRQGLTEAFGPHVYGRTDRPALLKPHPDSLERALRALGVEPADALMVGDTVADLGAARDAKVLFVGYARNEGKEKRLRAAGAGLVLGSLEALLDLLPAAPAP